LGEKRNTVKVLVEQSEESGHLEDVGVAGRIILKWILKEWMGGFGLD
jgi:hypothetical protein